MKNLKKAHSSTYHLNKEISLASSFSPKLSWLKASFSQFLWSLLSLKLHFPVGFWLYFWIPEDVITFYLDGWGGKEVSKTFGLRNCRAGNPALDIPTDQGGRFSFCIQPLMMLRLWNGHAVHCSLHLLRCVCEREQSHLWCSVCLSADLLAAFACSLVSWWKKHFLSSNILSNIFKLLLLSWLYWMCK